MLSLDIPGQDRVTIEHLILDFNGTIAVDGRLIAGVAQKLEELHPLITIHVITADTNETARSQLETLPCTLRIIGRQRQDEAKLEYARNLGLSKVLAIGNGSNDYLLLKEAALGICVIQGEGAAVKSMQTADIVCCDINDALEMLLRPHRITATLRN
jgi:soluble P-type ATPase